MIDSEPHTATVHIDAPPEAVYDLVSDITRMGEWSPENTGGEWIAGATGPAEGARFKGRNKRRLSWTTTCTVIAAERGREFSFDVGKGETRWRYRFEPTGGGTNVVESFAILKPPGRIACWLTRLGTGVAWAEREADLQRSMAVTLAALKQAAEARGR